MTQLEKEELRRLDRRVEGRCHLIVLGEVLPAKWALEDSAVHRQWRCTTVYIDNKGAADTLHSKEEISGDLRLSRALGWIWSNELNLKVTFLPGALNEVAGVPVFNNP